VRKALSPSFIFITSFVAVTPKSGMTADRIIVFYDPVSSLDSDVLFIVSSLIKRVLDEASRRSR
jgi:wobble nucleotide-excising tRNase